MPFCSFNPYFIIYLFVSFSVEGLKIILPGSSATNDVLKIRTKRAMQVPVYSTSIPKRQSWPLRAPIPSINNQVHLSLSTEQVNHLLDCLFYTASEANPSAFRKKALAMIHLVRCTPGYQVMTFEKEGSEEAGINGK